MIFDKEAAFEEAVIVVLKQHGWDDAGGVLRYPTEQNLIDNWAKILFQNNADIDRLNGCPLTQGEMAQVIEQIETLKTPLALNGFINGKSVAITRDNPDDALHLGKEVSLKIYDRQEIAAGQSRYQIAQQPVYPAKSKILNDRRGDLCLLINGMPVIHIELKRNGVPVSQATGQIEKYAHEGVFTGLFRLVQIFVGMTPDEARYFANPGAGAFNPNFYFHWEDFNNEPVCAGDKPGTDEWKRFTSTLLSIPMAHQLIGFYTVADSSDGCLKVMRSYQYYAAAAISDKVRRCKWDEPRHSSAPGRPGGYIWHTTGSGKTMTSFKSAQLIADSHDADKVVFLMDRIELGTQSLSEYRSFADDADDVQGTENTQVLKSKLASDDPKNRLIVTSIQKMSNLKAGESRITKAGDLIMSVRAPVGAMGKTAYDVVLGRGVAGIVGNEFLFQALSKKEAEGYWSTVSAGSTFDSINGDELRNTPVDYPRSKPEREAVGSCLSRIDCLITLHQRQSNGKAHNIIILSRTKNRQLDIAKSAVQGLETRGNSRKLLNEHPIQQRFLDIP